MKTDITKSAAAKRAKEIEDRCKNSKIYSAIYYIKAHYWRFTPDSWINWYYYWKGITHDKYFFWRNWSTKPWENNSRCYVCAGSKIHPKYGDECDECEGKGYKSRWNETWLSKLFKFLKIRFDNKPSKLFY
jgi:hypothetical protein